MECEPIERHSHEMLRRRRFHLLRRSLQRLTISRRRRGRVVPARRRQVRRPGRLVSCGLYDFCLGRISLEVQLPPLWSVRCRLLFRYCDWRRRWPRWQEADLGCGGGRCLQSRLVLLLLTVCLPFQRCGVTVACVCVCVSAWRWMTCSDFILPTMRKF